MIRVRSIRGLHDGQGRLVRTPLFLSYGKLSNNLIFIIFIDFFDGEGWMVAFGILDLDETMSD